MVSAHKKKFPGASGFSVIYLYGWSCNYLTKLCETDPPRSYVVDAADPDNIGISKSELHDLLSKPSLNGIPLLVLGNKIDKPGALSKQALTEEM